MTSADRIGELEEQVRQLKAALGGELKWPPAWRLTRNETRVLGVLVARSMVRVEAVLTLLNSGRREAPLDDSNVRQTVYHLRRKVAVHGVGINTSVGHGYWIATDVRARLRKAAEDFMETASS